MPFFPRDCYRNPYNTQCLLKKSEAEVRQSEQRAIILKLQQQHPSLKVFDPIGWVCPNNYCLFQNEEMIIYMDSHHLTARGSELYARYFLDWLSRQ